MSTLVNILVALVLSTIGVKTAQKNHEISKAEIKMCCDHITNNTHCIIIKNEQLPQQCKTIK